MYCKERVTRVRLLVKLFFLDGCICTSWLILLYYHKASKQKIIPFQDLVSVMLDKDTWLFCRRYCSEIG